MHLFPYKNNHVNLLLAGWGEILNSYNRWKAKYLHCYPEAQLRNRISRSLPESTEDFKSLHYLMPIMTDLLVNVSNSNYL